jgi:hypothetical protein
MIRRERIPCELMVAIQKVWRKVEIKRKYTWK